MRVGGHWLGFTVRDRVRVSMRVRVRVRVRVRDIVRVRGLVSFKVWVWIG